MEDVSLLIDLHRLNLHLGPGSENSTLRALELSGLLGRSGLRVADIGCGTGASALLLGERLDAHITAVDLFPAFVEELIRRAENRGGADRIPTMEASMDAYPPCRHESSREQPTRAISTLRLRRQRRHRQLQTVEAAERNRRL